MGKTLKNAEDKIQNKVLYRVYRIGSVIYVPDYELPNMWRGPGSIMYDVSTLLSAGAVETCHPLWPRKSLIKE